MAGASAKHRRLPRTATKCRWWVRTFGETPSRIALTSGWSAAPGSARCTSCPARAAVPMSV